MLFKNNDDKRIFELITGIHLYSERLIRQKLRKLNMTAPQFRTMMLLYKKDNLKLQRVKVGTFKAYLDFKPIINEYCYRIVSVGE